MTLLVLVTGCQAFGGGEKAKYTWAEEPIPAATRDQITFEHPIGRVAILADETSDWEIRVARSGDRDIYTTRRYLTDALVKQLSGEFPNWGGEADPKARRTLVLDVRDVEVKHDGVLSIATLEFRLRVGSGEARDLQAHFSAEVSPMRALDKVLANASAVVLLDSDAARYLRSD